MKYNHRVSSHRRRKFLKRVLILLIILGIIIGLITFVIKLDTYLTNKSNTPENTTTELSTVRFEPEVKIFNTSYFQFQTNKSWVELPSDSTQNKFVYRSLNKKFINSQLEIYVNDIPSDLKASRVLPVRLVDENMQINPAGTVSECNENTKTPVSDPQVVSYKSVTINCVIHINEYTVLLGLVGGTTELTLTRPGGSEAAYSIYYRNVTATPEPSDLFEILETFQTR